MIGKQLPHAMLCRPNPGNNHQTHMGQPMGMKLRRNREQPIADKMVTTNHNQLQPIGMRNQLDPSISFSLGTPST
jgi:hypothetical protein